MMTFYFKDYTQIFPRKYEDTWGLAGSWPRYLLVLPDIIRSSLEYNVNIKTNNFLLVAPGPVTV